MIRLPIFIRLSPLELFSVSYHISVALGCKIALRLWKNQPLSSCGESVEYYYIEAATQPSLDKLSSLRSYCLAFPRS